MQPDSSKFFDVMIVGAGMVGLTLANSLSGHGLKIAIIDRQVVPTTWPDEGYDLRVSAITRASELQFAQLGIWQQMKAMRISPYRRMKVWDSRGKGQIEFDADDINEINLGHIIENRVLRKALYEKLTTLDDVSIIMPCELENISEQEAEIGLYDKQGHHYRAKLVVAADGARSWVRDQCGFVLEEKPYQHHAIVTTISTQKPHGKTAYQSFSRQGILALLPLADNHRCSIVWSTTPESAQALCEMNAEQFNEALTQCSSNELGVLSVLDKRIHFPLIQRHAVDYVKPRVALIGDAAHTIHPLAGQGVNLGLMDAACLSQVLLQAKSRHKDFGALSVLRKYQRARKGPNTTMMVAMAGFKQIFEPNFNPLIWVRNNGLSLVNRLTPAKQILIRYAMGLTKI